MFKNLVVVNKLTYLLLALIPAGLAKIVLFDLKQKTNGDIFWSIVVSVIMMFFGLYFFVKVNSYSHWLNPNHPKSKE